MKEKLIELLKVRLTDSRSQFKDEALSKFLDRALLTVKCFVRGDVSFDDLKGLDDLVYQGALIEALAVTTSNIKLSQYNTEYQVFMQKIHLLRPTKSDWNWTLNEFGQVKTITK